MSATQITFITSSPLQNTIYIGLTIIEKTFASEKFGRENVTDKREILVKKGAERERERSTNMQGKGGETGKRKGKEKKMERKDEGGGGGVKEREGLSREEISKYRQTARQNSMEAIRAAEERYTKASEAEETVPSVSERAKDVAVDTAKKVGSYAGEKAVAAKDVTVGTGKSAAGYAGKVGGEVKDKAVVAGLGVAHCPFEKTVEATKAAADVARGVAGYAGEKAAAAKDVIVATEESAEECTARKMAEAERELEAKKSSDQPKGETGGQEIGGGEVKSWAQEVVQKPTETVQEFYQGAPEHERRQHQGGGILQAIVETIVEIAETTKDLVVGQDQTGAEQGDEPEPEPELEPEDTTKVAHWST